MGWSGASSQYDFVILCMHTAEFCVIFARVEVSQCEKNFLDRFGVNVTVPLRDCLQKS